MASRTVAIALTIGSLTLGACAHPFLRAGGALGTAVQKGDAAVATVLSAEADTYRVYYYVQPALRIFNVNQPSDIEVEFIQLACRPHARTLLSEHVALANLEQFRAALEANATDPKDPALASLIGSLAAPAVTFNPQTAKKAAEEYQAKADKDAAQCLSDVPTTFLAPASNGAPTATIALAAWPKVKESLVLVLSEADKAKREAVILQMLKDPATTALLTESLKILDDSIATGRMGELTLSQKQLALWSAYSQFLTIKELKKTRPAGSPPLTYEDFKKINEAALAMAAQLKVYDTLAAVDLSTAMKAMRDAIAKLQRAATSSSAPEGSVMAELFAALDFLSDISEKYGAAAEALKPKAPAAK